MRTALIALGVAATMGVSAVHAAPIRFGIQTSQQDVTYEQVRDIWNAADELGFYSAMNYDDLMPILGADWASTITPA